MLAATVYMHLCAGMCTLKNQLEKKITFEAYLFVYIYGKYFAYDKDIMTLVYLTTVCCLCTYG